MINFIGPLISGLFKLGTTWVDNKGKIAQARVDAEVTVIKKQAESKADWNALMAKGAMTSWKDEWFVILFSIPMVLSFFPVFVPVVEEGFRVLATMPDWYKAFLGAAVAASFGIRALAGKFGK